MPSAENPLARSSAEDSAASVVALLRALRKHWVAIAACAALGVGVAYAYAKSLPKVFQSAAMIEIDPHAAQPLGDKANPILDLGAGLFFDSREYYETQYRIITSEKVLGAVARDLGLANDLSFMGLKSAPAQPMSAAAAAGVLRGRVSIEAIKYSRLALIKVEDTDPKRAKRLADAIAATYIAQNLDSALSSTADAVVWLNGQVAHVESELQKNEGSLHEFKKQNDLPSTSINEASNMLRLEMQDLNASLTRTRTRHAELLARYTELKKVGADNPDELPSSELLASPFLQGLRGHYQDAVRDRDALLAEGKLENHPQMKRATERVIDTRAALLHEVKNIQGAVERDLAIITRQEGAEAGLFNSARQRAVDLNMKEIEYHRLDRSRAENEKLYSMLQERLKEADLARMMKVNNVRVVEAAFEPGGPIRPRVPMIAGFGLAIGLAIGFLGAWIRHQLDSSVKTPDDIEQKLRTTFLGLLPDFEGSAGKRSSYYGKRRRHAAVDATNGQAGSVELTVHDKPMSGIAEAARSVRTNLMFMNPDKPYRKLLVSSAAPSEGKTTVACSLAIAFAQSGQRVVIVDCDLRRPRLHRVFNRVGDVGVTNVLVGDATVAEAAKPTRVPNLWAIPAGPTPPNPADLLHSARFREFIAELGRQFDRVIIDSPPLVAVTDSAIISTLVDGSVFVVRAFKTSTHLSLQGLRALREIAAPIVGAVLNAVNLNRHEYSYGYHYYYYRNDGAYRSAPTEPLGQDEPGDGSRSASPPN
jgi:capsular exopolysaccharide synthesis family protein